MDTWQSSTLNSNSNSIWSYNKTSLHLSPPDHPTLCLNIGLPLTSPASEFQLYTCQTNADSDSDSGIGIGIGDGGGDADANMRNDAFVFGPGGSFSLAGLFVGVVKANDMWSKTVLVF